MKDIIKDLIKDTLKKNFKDVSFDYEQIEVNLCKNKKFGDYSSNVAMKIAKENNNEPISLAEKIKSSLEKSEQFERVEAIKPGFINFFVSENLKFLVVEKKILREKELYGKNSIGKNSKVLVEFVSANPTGPLHVGHGRGAVFGDLLVKAA